MWGLLTNGKKMKADAVIVATGGISYPSTGLQAMDIVLRKKQGIE